MDTEDLPMYSAPIENEQELHKCLQIIRNSPETTDGGRQSMIRRILARINLAGGHFKLL